MKLKDRNKCNEHGIPEHHLLSLTGLTDLKEMIKVERLLVNSQVGYLRNNKSIYEIAFSIHVTSQRQ